jgi:hypothetical protein
MRQLRTALLGLMAAALGCGYAANGRFTYDPPPIQSGIRPPVRVAVKDFTDARGPRSYPSLQGRAFLTYVPLIPYIRIPYERLDESYSIRRERAGETPEATDLFPHLMARAVARDLAMSGLAEDAFLLGEGEPHRPAHLLLTGELYSTAFDTYRTSYMLGMPGVLLWFLPIPAGGTTARVKLDLSLQDPVGQEVWSCTASGKSSAITTLYNSENVASTSSRFRVKIHHFGSNKKGIDPDSLWAYHADALRSGMAPCRESLAQFLAAYTPQPPVSFAPGGEPEPGPGKPPAVPRDREDRLRELRDLLEKGLITRDDFELRKREILEDL